MYRRERQRSARRRFLCALLVLVGVSLLVVTWHLGRGGRMGSLALGGAGASWFVAWMVRPVPDPQRWLRGAAGEAATALILDRLPKRRYHVAHDRRVPGSGANVDHLVIGPGGVWVIDSKAYRAPLHTGWRSVWVGERRLDVTAVAWEASVVSDRLAIDARPLVVIHGRGLSRRGRVCDGVRVVPADGLLRRIKPGAVRRRLRRTGRRLSAQQAAQLAAAYDGIFAPAATWHDASRAGAGSRRRHSVTESKGRPG